MKKTLISFRIESKFEDWVNIFDSKDAERRHSGFDIKLLLGGFRKDNSQKVICIEEKISKTKYQVLFNY